MMRRLVAAAWLVSLALADELATQEPNVNKIRVADSFEEYENLPAAEQAIVNGCEVDVNEAKWYARLLICFADAAGNNNGCFYCGGSFVSPRRIVTAAHCVMGDGTPTARVYTNDGSNFIPTNVNPTYQIIDIGIHASYIDGQVGLGHDIAMLKLGASDNDFPDYIEMATVDDFDALSMGTEMIAYGTGTIATGGSVTNTLLESYPLGLMDCAGMTFWSWYVQGVLQNNYNLGIGSPIGMFLCVNTTVSPDTGYQGSICQGDSGGPLVTGGKLFGVTSYNYPPCQQFFPQVFMNVGHFLSTDGFIPNNMPSIPSSGFQVPQANVPTGCVDEFFVSLPRCESLAPCQNGAQCEDILGGVICTCAPGFEGEFCEFQTTVAETTTTSPCANVNCGNGQCSIGADGSATCTCQSGFIGDSCSTVDSCAAGPCQNGGTCVNGDAQSAGVSPGDEISDEPNIGMIKVSESLEEYLSTPSHQQAIVNGCTVDQNEANWYARLLICFEDAGGNSNGCFFCGGSFVSPRRIATAAHCVIGDGTPTVNVFVNDGSNFIPNSFPTYQLTDIEFHASYVDGNVGLGNDVAIAKFSASHADWPNYIEMATSSDFNALSVGTEMIAYGTGTTASGGSVTNTLLESYPLSLMDCAGMSFYGWWVQGFFQGNYNLATGNPTIEMYLCVNGTASADTGYQGSICQGDSGGPLVSGGKLFGITSYNYPPCQQFLPQVFMNVGHFLSTDGFIANNVPSIPSSGFQVPQANVPTGCIDEWFVIIPRCEQLAPCQNGATCEDINGGVICTCASGFTGEFCEISGETTTAATTTAATTTASPCALINCNNGQCSVGADGSPTCTCSPGFKGTLCDEVDASTFTCTCQSGFMGPLCETINFCVTSPCQNGGSCSNGNTGHICACLDGFEGDDCSVAITTPAPTTAAPFDFCALNLCENGSTCTNNPNDFTCECLENFSGVLCSDHPCDSSPCVSGQGECVVDVAGNPECNCFSGFLGSLCNVIDHCAQNPCENNGVCNNGNTGFTCTCADGFEGNTCATTINHCDPNECQNGSTCINNPAVGFTCTCVDHFSGETCAEHPCDDLPCVDGECQVDAGGNPECSCAFGFMGTLCDVINHCAQNPCENNGVCNNGNNGFTCTCADGFEGNTCATTINHCDPNECQNGSTCMNNPAVGFTCTCVDHFSGETCAEHPCDDLPCVDGDCQVDAGGNPECSCAFGFMGTLCDVINHCAQDPCQNGGFCTNGNTQFICTCADGFEGDTCATTINHCAQNPCANDGVCVNDSLGFTCNCANGFEGDTCESMFDFCGLNLCQNGAGCTNNGPDFTCHCTGDFTGIMCDDHPCDVDPCVDGQCFVDAAGNAACDCSPGFMGNFCNVVDHCFQNPCQNDGVCENGNTQFTCICAEGFEGDTCATTIDHCDPNECQNGSTCVNNPAVGFTCTCVDHFSGETCADHPCDDLPCVDGECQVDAGGNPECSCDFGFMGTLCDVTNHCAQDPCQNGGFCTNGNTQFICTCADGFEGDTCATAIDHCDPNECQNGSTCVNNPAVGFTCTCVDHYSGETCAEHPCDDLPCVDGECQVDAGGNPECSCAFGFMGTLCDVINHCAQDPCQNGGFCTNGNTQFICTCADGFEGDTCATTINHCASNPCANDGECINDSLGFTCNCANGFEGVTCETMFDFCGLNLCQNGAGCTNNGPDFTCHCTDDWVGIMCDESPCDFLQCGLNGECQLDAGGNPECSCAFGFMGTLCDETDFCALEPCENGGFCTNEFSQNFICTCADGFEGTTCAIEITTTASPTTASTQHPCVVLGCVHGFCSIDASGAAYCDCEFGFQGTICDEPDACFDQPCQNGGECFVEDSTSFVCVCVVHFFGDRCDQHPCDAANNPCDQGICIMGNVAPMCECDTNFVGPLCDECVCDQGICILDDADEPMCECEIGYIGLLCDTFDHCMDDPCQNSGVCTNVPEAQAFSCDCMSPYFGDMCTAHPCDNFPCNQGECDISAADGNAVCFCHTGYMGNHCDTFDHCMDDPCQNGGVCTNVPEAQAFSCECVSPWFGDMCTIFPTTIPETTTPQTTTTPQMDNCGTDSYDLSVYRCCTNGPPEMMFYAVPIYEDCNDDITTTPETTIPTTFETTTSDLYPCGPSLEFRAFTHQCCDNGVDLDPFYVIGINDSCDDINHLCTEDFTARFHPQFIHGDDTIRPFGLQADRCVLNNLNVATCDISRDMGWYYSTKSKQVANARWGKSKKCWTLQTSRKGKKTTYKLKMSKCSSRNKNQRFVQVNGRIHPASIMSVCVGYNAANSYKKLTVATCNGQLFGVDTIMKESCDTPAIDGLHDFAAMMTEPIYENGQLRAFKDESKKGTCLYRRGTKALFGTCKNVKTYKFKLLSSGQIQTMGSPKYCLTARSSTKHGTAKFSKCIDWKGDRSTQKWVWDDGRFVLSSNDELVLQYNVQSAKRMTSAKVGADITNTFGNVFYDVVFNAVKIDNCCGISDECCYETLPKK